MLRYIYIFHIVYRQEKCESVVPVSLHTSVHIPYHQSMV